MSKKNKKPQVRKRTKETTGHVKIPNVIYLEREKVDGEYQFRGVCSCDKWRSSDEATSLTKIGMEAKAHAIASNGDCALAQHAASEESETPALEDVDKEFRDENVD